MATTLFARVTLSTFAYVVTTGLPAAAQTCTGRVLDVSTFPGADLGAKINAAAAASNNLDCGVILDARSFTGSQTAAATISLGSTTSPVPPLYPKRLLLGAVQLTVSGSGSGIKLGPRSSIEGVPTGLSVGPIDHFQPSRAGYTEIKAGSASVAAVLQVGVPGTAFLGDDASIRNVVVNGNNLAIYGIHVYRSARVDMENVTATLSAADGIFIEGTAGAGCLAAAESGDNELRRVAAISNGGSGLHLKHSFDDYLDHFEANSNTLDGLFLEQSSGTRIIHSDISNNVNGIHMLNTFDVNLSSSQFADNREVDVRREANTCSPALGYGDIIANNTFIGSSTIAGNVPVIYFNGSQSTLVSGNTITISSQAGHTSYTGIQFDGSGKGNRAVGNTFMGGSPAVGGNCYILKAGVCQFSPTMQTPTGIASANGCVAAGCL